AARRWADRHRELLADDLEDQHAESPGSGDDASSRQAHGEGRGRESERACAGDDLEDQHAESPGSGDDGSSCRVQGEGVARDGEGGGMADDGIQREVLPIPDRRPQHPDPRPPARRAHPRSRPPPAPSVGGYRPPTGDPKIRTAEHRRPGPPWAPGPGRNQDIATLFLSIAVATTLAGPPRRLVPTTTSGTAGPGGGGPHPAR